MTEPRTCSNRLWAPEAFGVSRMKRCGKPRDTVTFLGPGIGRPHWMGVALESCKRCADATRFYTSGGGRSARLPSDVKPFHEQRR